MRPPALLAVVSRLMDAPAWRRHGALLLLAAVASGLCWWLTLRDLQAAVKAADMARELDVVRLGERVAADRRVDSAAALDASQHGLLADLERSLVSESTGSAVWASVHSASRQHALRMALFKPGSVGTEKPYPAQRAQLRLIGSFEALLGFTRDLAADGGLVALESFALTPYLAANGAALGTGPEPGLEAGLPDNSLVLDATLLALHRPQAPGLADNDAVKTSARPPAAQRPQEAPAAATPDSARSALPPGVWGDPFRSQRLFLPPAANADPPSGLQALPLTSVRMVGSVQTPGRVVALVQLAGQLHAVGVGDGLGNGRGRVVEIHADRLTVQEPGGSGAPGTSGRSVTLLLAKE